MVKENEKIRELTKQNEELKLQLAESQETLRAIQSGEVDALVVQSPSGQQVYTLKDAEHPYRVMVETMNEGAATLAADGTVFYCNRQLADLLKVPLDKVMATPLTNFVAPADLPVFESMLRQATSGISRAEIELKTPDGVAVPVLVSARALDEENRQMVSLVVTDLSEQKRDDKIIAEARLLQAIMAESGEGVIVCDAEGIIMHMSLEAQKMVGHYVVGRRFKDEFTILRVDNIPVTLRSLISGEIPNKTEVTFKQDGEEKTYLLSYAKLAAEEMILGHIITLTNVTRLKQIEQNIKQNENKYRSLFENMGEAAILTEAVFDAQGKPTDYIIIETNKAWNTLYWPSGKDLLGETILGILPNISRHWLDNAAIVSTTGVNRHVEYFSQLFNKWLEVDFYSPKPGQVAAISSDITGRKKTEEALKESEMRFRLVMRHAPVSVAVQDLDLKYIWAFNQKTASPNGIVGRYDREIFTPEEAAQVTEMKKRVIKEDTDLSIQRWFDRPSGRIFLAVYWEPIHDTSGRVIGVGSATLDMTPVKIAEEALARSESKFHGMFNTMNEGMALHEIIFDGNGKAVDYRLLEVNPAYEHITGLPREKTIGEKASELYGTGKPPYFDIYERVITTRQPETFDSYFAPLQKYFMISVFATDNTHFATIFSDITVGKEAEAELKRNALELQTMNQELEAFSFSVSHDLRAPLRSLSGFSKILLEDYGEKLDAAGKSHLDRIFESSEHMGHLIDDLLKLARIAQSNISFTKLNLSEIAQKIVEELRSNDPKRKAEVLIEPGLVACGDRVLLGQVLENLLGNAWKYSGKKPETKIEMGSVEHDGKTAYYIRDNGAGFNMDYAEKLFKPFQRLHAASEFEGTGIGLAIVQRIVRRHGGTVWAEGKRGEGATFYFTLG